MALDGPITYNGLTITPGTVSRPAGGGPGSGIRATHFDISPVSLVQYLDKAALRDGMVAGDVYLGERTVSLGLEIYGRTSGDMWDKLQSFAAAFHPTNAFIQGVAGSNGFMPLTFRQPTANTGTWASGYIPMQLYARASAPPTYAESVGYDSGGVAAKGLVMPASVRMLCIDPRKYLTSNQTLNLSVSTQSMTHRGDYPTWPTATLTMSGAGSAALNIRVWHLSNPATVTLDLSGRIAGDVVVIDWATRKVTVNGTLTQALLASSSAWYDVRPGSMGGASIDLNNMTGLASAVATWTEAWS